MALPSHQTGAKQDMKSTSFFLGLMMVMAVFQNREVEAGTHCVDSMFLRAGSRGVVSCDFGDFDVVGWLYSTTDLESAVPFISWDGSEIHQSESDNEEYSILPNGSLVIENVAVSHEKNYTARVYKNQGVFHEEVPVKVYVLPDPEHPVVNGHSDQDHVVVHSSNGGASFNCTMDHIRPAVPLEVVFVSNTSSSITKKTIQSTLNNSDGTHNVSLHVELEIGITQPIGIHSMLCKVAENFAHLFPSVVTVDLVHGGDHPLFPVVKGFMDRQHVVLNASPGDTLHCFKEGVLPNVNLTWELSLPSSSDELVIYTEMFRACDNGICNIRKKVTLWPRTISLMHAVLKCKLSVEGFALSVTTVEVLFQKNRRYNFPSVNRLDSQQHVVLDVEREGVLNCSMDRVPPNLILKFDLIQQDSSAEIVLDEHNHHSLDNGDGTFNIILISRFKTTSTSVQRLNLKCMVSGKDADLYPLYTTVELNFPAADRGYSFPSVNGRDSQQHVVLDVDREGVLNCSMDRVPPDVILEWDLIQHDSPPEIAIDRQGHHSFENGDGTNNILLISRFKTTSNSVQHLVLKCMVSGKDADLYPLYTTVELNFPAADSDSRSNTSPNKGLLVLICVLPAITMILTLYLTLKIRRMSNKNSAPQIRCISHKYPDPQVPLQERECMLQQRPKSNTHPDNRTA